MYQVYWSSPIPEGPVFDGQRDHLVALGHARRDDAEHVDGDVGQHGAGHRREGRRCRVVSVDRPSAVGGITEPELEIQLERHPEHDGVIEQVMAGEKSCNPCHELAHPAHEDQVETSTQRFSRFIEPEL